MQPLSLRGRLPKADARSHKSMHLEQTAMNRHWDFRRLPWHERSDEFQIGQDFWAAYR